MTVLFSFNACGSDDDNSGKPDDNKTSKKITKIRTTTKDEYKDEIIDIFKYSKDGELINWEHQILENGVNNTNDSDYCNLSVTSRDKDKIVVKGISEGDNVIETYTLNKDGLVTLIEQANQDEPEENYRWNFQYSNGYLIHLLFTENDGTSYLQEFSYSNGNMIKVVDEDSDFINFSYLDDLNKGQIFNNHLSDDNFYLKFWQFLGIQGKASSNLVKSYNDSESRKETFVYTFDNDGYVTRAESELHVYEYTYE
ncbi:DUF4595 domain-containing protein [Wolbachia endosymbiont of Zaprionus taronus]|uniref:DUF4595 domain-containing protein n=1 Tax=Wolbachia endosymbiont of Zaprionus taronus TaxID=2603208 RepID=UPI00294901B7|nr:DUF4595 domain-containing protein [Wolbachia endosymbiont of Zaprionus taronus]MDV6249460.1 DUF4595 domain-containing protein [Wolbachia endosymbiont of Zaprionus taronus]